MVLLAMRPYGGYFYNLGRETFLAPVRWEDGWPVVSPGTGRVEFSYPAPDLPEHRWPAPSACDHFDGSSLGLQWHSLREPADRFASLTERPGFLRLKLRPETLAEHVSPSFIGRRQQHINFMAQTAVEFKPNSDRECAGLVLIQNSDFHFRLVMNQNSLKLIKRAGGVDEQIAEQSIAGDRMLLKVEAHEQEYSFYGAMTGEDWRPIAERVDGRILSTPVAGGFVGAFIGMYASSTGKASSNHADFDYFEYAGLDE
jgi:alpha-N-arabinofuranosidase